MYDKIDGLILGFILIGTLYGLFKGPFALLLPIAGVAVGHSLISWLRLPLLAFFTDEGTRTIVSLIYYPLSYFVFLGLLSFAGRRIDRKISRLLPLGRYLLGGFLGFCLSAFSILTVLAITFPLIKKQSPDNYQKSLALRSAEVFFNQNPTLQQQIYRILRYDQLEKQLSIIKAKQEIPGKNNENSPFATDGKESISLDEHSAELNNILGQLEKLAAQYETLNSELGSPQTDQTQTAKPGLNQENKELKKFDPDKLRKYQTELMKELENYQTKNQ